MSPLYGAFIKSEWRLAIQVIFDGKPSDCIIITDAAPYRTEHAARKAAARLNKRFGENHSRYVAIKADLGIREIPA